MKRIRVKPSAKLKALEVLGNHFGLFGQQDKDNDAAMQLHLYLPDNGRDPGSVNTNLPTEPETMRERDLGML